MRDYTAMIDSLVKRRGITREDARERVARAEKLRDLMHQRSITASDVAKLTCRSLSTVYHWRSCTFAIPLELLRLIDYATKDRKGQ